MIQTLLSHIQKHAPLTNAQAQRVADAVTPISLKKKEFLLQAGTVCPANYFVVEGCLRMYIINDDGDEQVVQFAIENWWLTDYFSLKGQKPAQFSIQAVEDSEVLALDVSVQEALFGQVPPMERYFRKVLEKAYSAQLMRIHYIFSLSGEERYRHFSAVVPEFVQRVPQYMLASYLGFTPEFLSKIRAKK